MLGNFWAQKSRDLLGNCVLQQNSLEFCVHKKLINSDLLNTAKDKFIYYIILYNYMTLEILHYPNLKTVLEVEKVLQEADTVISRNELKRRLPTQIMHQTLNVILEYLEESGKIMIGEKGITWIQHDSPKLKTLLERGVRIA